MKNVIDLTQNSDDDDFSNIQAPFDDIASNQLGSLPTPIMFLPKPGFMDDPFNVPLINTSNSIAYAFSSSNVDPFSNLLRLLHQNTQDNSLFFQLTQALAFNAQPVDFLPILIAIIESESTAIALRHLALQSIIVLSVNNEEFCKAVLQNAEKFLQLSMNDEFLRDVLEILIAVCEFAEHDQADTIIKEISKRELIKKEHYRDLRGKTHTVLSLLSCYADLYPNELVDEIKRRCNYHDKSGFNRDIMWPCLVSIDMFLKQPETAAYKLLSQKRTSTELLGKLALAIVGCEKKDDVELRVLVLKVFLEACIEFHIDDLSLSIPDFQFNLTSVLISLLHFAEEPVKRMAERLVTHFNIS